MLKLAKLKEAKIDAGEVSFEELFEQYSGNKATEYILYQKL